MKEKGIWYYDELDTPVGPMIINMFNDKMIRIDFGTFSQKKNLYKTWAKKYIDVVGWEQDDKKMKNIKNELDEYFAGIRTSFTFPYVFYGTEFQISVWKYLVEYIRFGELQTYKDVAVGVNRSKAYRAVGGAVNKNPFSIVIPCHRIVGSSGALVGYGGGLDTKEFLLELEQAN